MNDDGFSDDFGDFESSRQSVEAAGSFTNKALKTSNVDTTFDDDATDEDDEPSSPNRQQQSSVAVPEITKTPAIKKTNFHSTSVATISNVLKTRGIRSGNH